MSKYIALLDLDFTWERKEIYQFDIMWRQGKSLEEIANRFERDLDEVAVLIMDRIRKGKIQQRPGGVFGSGKEHLQKAR